MEKLSASGPKEDAPKTSFIILGAGRPHRGSLHSALHLQGKKRILDWLLQTAASFDPDFVFVGGYGFEDIVKKYTEIKYAYNPEWESTGSVFSLLKAPFGDYQWYFISYSDILFRKSALERMSETDTDIVVAVDSHWRKRYEGRTQEDLYRCEKVNFLEGGSITASGVDIDPETNHAEFIGLVRFSPRVISLIQENASIISEALRSSNLSGLIEFLRIRGCSAKAVDVYGDWAEINAPSDLARFIMGTKAQTLQRLEQMVTRSTIKEQVCFSVTGWLQNNSSVLSSITDTFGKQKVIVRSSCANEDSFTTANAGVYKSFLNIDCDNRQELSDAINEVVAAYPKQCSEDQILIQAMVEDIRASGVVFTRTLVYGGPYYVINYDDLTQSTESITNGSSCYHKTMVVFRNNDRNVGFVPDAIKGLLPAIYEIEHLLDYDSLDIEFAINAKGQIYIFQVRPIVYKNNSDHTTITDQKIYDAITSMRNRFRMLQTRAPFVAGTKAYFGIMPDWNPAEIIGTKPHMLAVSLYRYLITDEVWAKQRAEYGYKDLRPRQLMITFGGHPYIDIRASFASFIPAEIPNELADRLVDFYLDWLRKNPHLHDKVEFEVVPTSFSFDFPRWKQRLIENSFTTEEVAVLQSSLKEITRASFDRNKSDLTAITVFEKRFEHIRSADIPDLEKALLLLEDCRLYGTLAFAHLARSAFIGVSLLRSAVYEKIITQGAMDDFLSSVHSVTHQFIDAAEATSRGEMDWEIFCKTFGHLRPGTYDITSLSYAEKPEYFLRPIIQHTAKTTAEKTVDRWHEEKEKFALNLAEIGLPSDLNHVETFIREAIEGREYAKFIFTRNLSAALDCLILFGKTHGINRDDLADISLDNFQAIHSGSLFSPVISDLLQKQSENGRKAYALLKQIELPSLLFSEDDFDIFTQPHSQPNFIGSGRITASCILLENIKETEQKNISGCIVLIQQADPGYDWLFGRGIVGLITMWGGANSHMAIRAAEFGIPSAIGLGEAEFSRLLSATIITLDAQIRQIQIVR